MVQRKRRSFGSLGRWCCEQGPIATLGLQLLLLRTTCACPGNLPFKPEMGNQLMWSTVLEGPTKTFYYSGTKHATWEEGRRECEKMGGMLSPPSSTEACVYGTGEYHDMAVNLRKLSLPRTSPSPWVGVRFYNGSWRDLAGKGVPSTVWAMAPIKAEDRRIFDPNDRCAFIFIFAQPKMIPVGTGELFGLVDGSCRDRRSVLCAVEVHNETHNSK